MLFHKNDEEEDFSHEHGMNGWKKILRIFRDGKI